MTIPSPSSLHFRYGRDAVPEAIYPDMDDFYRDLGTTYRQGRARLCRRGLPLSAARRGQSSLICAIPRCAQQVADRGDDPRAAAGDLCRHDQRRDCRHSARHDHHHASVPRQFPAPPSSPSGGYEPVAEILFNTINVHGYFMEYDSDRAGGFEPLRFVPKGKTVVLGLVTSKSGRLESKDELKRRIEQAAKFVAARSALPVAAMRLRLDRGRQYPGRGRAMGEAQHDRRTRGGSLGMTRNEANHPSAPTMSAACCGRPH